MRRIFIWLTALVLLLCSLAVGAEAAVSAPKATVFATVNQNGSCQVTVTMNLHITEQTKGITYPVPEGATGVKVNGSRFAVRKDGSQRYVNLDRMLSKALGDVTFTVSYTLPDVIHTTETGTPELRLPILSGFESAVDKLEYTVTLPGNVQGLPGFESGYHQRSIEEDLTYRVDGAMITGNSLAKMKDHETLVLLLAVDETMFPQKSKLPQDASPATIGMGVCAGLALLYWVFFLWFWPLRRERCAEPPEGRTAGEMSCVLHLQGVDLTMTVLSWARLGYVVLQTGRKGRVLIHRRMEMGNERKAAEQRLFSALFAKGDTVDTSSARYAKLRLDARKKPGTVQELINKRSGNTMVFRGLAAGIGLFGGVAIALAISAEALLLVPMILVLGVLGAVSGWYMQLWGTGLAVRDPLRLYTGLGIGAIWLLFSLACSVFSIGLWMVIGLLVAGLLLAWGGRRTEQGKLEVARIRGLRHYMRTAEKDDLRRLCQNDPDYFFELAPCAIALGMGSIFAQRFSGIHMENCPYLMTDVQTKRTAGEWIRLLEQMVNSMDARSRQLPWEQLLAVLRNFRK